MRLFLYHTNFTIQPLQNLAEVKHNNNLFTMCYNFSKESDIIVLSCILGFVKQILKFFLL